MKNPQVVQALLQINRDESGRLPPERVVSVASDPASPLHSCFTWDDTKAAHEHRLWQARELIANVRIFRDEQAERPIQVFVSLANDRKDGGGYRLVTDVLADPDLRAQMLATALGELKAFQDRYERFQELAGVFSAIKKTSAKIKRKSKAA